MPERSKIDWDQLLNRIRGKRKVIPVVGAELLTADDGGRRVPFYRAVADRLLNKYGFASAVPLRENRELNDAVCALVDKGEPVDDIYGSIHTILQKLTAEQKEILEPLRQLAEISHFDLFATTTPDDLLVRALNAVRFSGVNKTDQIEYAPKLSSERRRDLTELYNGRAAVFYLFGKADPDPFFAIHDEDALEFAYGLQAGGGPGCMLSQLRSRDLLLIGCTFADWLSQFFLRLSNLERLSSQRVKREFLVGEESASDQDLMVFLDRFSHNTRCYEMDAQSFVSQLYEHWVVDERSNKSIPPNWTSPRDVGDGVFISYAREDLDAATKLCADLQQIGADVPWFDKTTLGPGDQWEPATRSAIQRCTLFLPLLSANTEQRTEGYFRLEWRLAVERCRKIQGQKFILPVVIDPEFTDAPAQYKLVPEEFKDFQYGHAPVGQISGELKKAIIAELRDLRRDLRAG